MFIKSQEREKAIINGKVVLARRKYRLYTDV